MNQHRAYLQSLEEVAAATQRQLDLTKHRGEEGRHVEGIVKGMLEKLLPKKFSIGSGFVVNFSGEMSTQQDIVLFDHINNAPLMYEGQSGVFTAESVYATIEVKKNLNRKELSKTAWKAVAFSRLTKKKLVHMIDVDVLVGNGVFALEPRDNPGAVPVAARTYLVAMGANEKAWGDNIEAFQAAVAKVCNTSGCHFHGVCVLGKDWFATRMAYKTPADIRVSQGNALVKLYSRILADSMTFIVRPAFHQAYFDPNVGNALWDEATKTIQRHEGQRRAAEEAENNV